MRLRAVWRHPLMGKFLVTALPLMLGQTIMMLDEQFLRVFGSLVGDGAVSLLNYARRITQVPVGLSLIHIYPPGIGRRLHRSLVQRETARWHCATRREIAERSEEAPEAAAAQAAKTTEK